MSAGSLPKARPWTSDEPYDVSIAIRAEDGVAATNDDVACVLHPCDGETLCLLADGLGGHAAGALAATIAVDTIERATRGGPVDRARLLGIVADANSAIVAAQGRARGLRDMRATLALLHLDRSSAWWLHCGDTRVYRYRGRELIDRTLDHTVAQMEAGGGSGDGDRATPSPDRHRLLRVLGGASERESRPRVAREPVPLRAGDRFVLCTDGWWACVDMDQAGQTDGDEPASWLESLWRGAEHDEAAAADDATAVAVVVGR